MCQQDIPSACQHCPLPDPAEAHPTWEQAWASGAAGRRWRALSAQLPGSRRQGLTVLPQISHKLVRGGIEEGSHIVIQWVHVLGQPGARVVVHLPRTNHPTSQMLPLQLRMKSRARVLPFPTRMFRGQRGNDVSHPDGNPQKPMKRPTDQYFKGPCAQ